MAVHWTTCVFAVLSTAVVVRRVTCVDVRVGYTDLPHRLTPALIALSLDRARNEGLLLDHNISLAYRTHDCKPYRAVASELELIDDANVDVVLGQTCSTGCIAAGYVDTYRNIARFPTGCSDPTMADKVSYSTLVRCISTSDKIGKAIEQVFLRYQWTRTALMYSMTGMCEFAIRHARERFNDINVTVTDLKELATNPEEVTDKTIREGLSQMKDNARVMIICHKMPVIRRIIDVAQEFDMVSSDFVFLYYEILPTEETHRPWIGPEETFDQTRIEKRKEAFRAFKQITLASLNIEKYDEFFSNVSARSAMKPWGIEVEEISTFRYLMFMVDCSYLYFQVLSEMLAEEADHRDGREVFNRARNREFYGWTGRVVMNDNADRDPDFWVWDCPVEEEECKPYSYVTISPPKGMTDMRIPYWGTPDGERPPDTPPCGFHGEFCPQDKHTTTKALGIAAGLVVVLVVALALGHYKRQQYREKLLQVMTWKVNYSDIDFNTRLANGGTSVRSMKSMASIAKSQTSFASFANSHNAQMFTNVGLFNGMLVAVRQIDKHSLTVTRNLLVELKNMKDLVHENINPFIGACIEPQNVHVLSTYCTKGSLQDVIENDDIALDWMFKSSLIRDLINGMCYLTTSTLKSHGSLRSSKCMIDGRWMLKICDFGLTRFREGEKVENESEFKKYQKLLWTAPELLRTSERERPAYGTEKGDVYSFAIIVQEIVYRAAPFFDSMTPKDVVSLVEAGDGIPFRPSLPEGKDQTDKINDVKALIVRCWNEDPVQRPHFDDIKKLFRQINKGENSNIMDNMIQMMEKYASNLEGLVQERTGELLDEKKKTDMLLYRMLPPTVADKLKVGEQMNAEMYENVTIYFSDIVGFTSLSSSSTPMEVVDLLNDLYTTFDSTIKKYDVYKVETIGDAYMVVSGVPRRNGTNHAPEIADMALSLLKQVLTFKIRHRPDLTLNLRIGLHTGSCAAGVVGLTMPRFCLFGDTVNMASRMESTGEAQKIHISECTQTMLSKIGQYNITYRGETAVKGKSQQKTYWLDSRVVV